MVFLHSLMYYCILYILIAVYNLVAKKNRASPPTKNSNENGAFVIAPVGVPYHQSSSALCHQINSIGNQQLKLMMIEHGADTDYLIEP